MTRTAGEEISLQQLRALAAVADTGSFTLAAEALQLTQPAISHLIKRMEHELGQPLVVRGRRIRMTRAGQMMVDTAVRALRLVDESVGACRSQSQLREGRVVLAVGHLTAGALLPLLAVVLPPADWRVPVTVVSVLVALTATGWSAARLGAAAPGRAVVRNVGGGALAMGVTYVVGSLLGATGV